MWKLKIRLHEAQKTVWYIFAVRAMLAWYISSFSCHRVSVRPSPYDSPGTLVFDTKNIGEITTTSPPMGAPNRGGVGSHRRFSTNISLYLRNEAR